MTQSFNQPTRRGVLGAAGAATIAAPALATASHLLKASRFVDGGVFDPIHNPA